MAEAFFLVAEAFFLADAFSEAFFLVADAFFLVADAFFLAAEAFFLVADAFFLVTFFDTSLDATALNETMVMFLYRVSFPHFFLRKYVISFARSSFNPAIYQIMYYLLYFVVLREFYSKSCKATGILLLLVFCSVMSNLTSSQRFKLSCVINILFKLVPDFVNVI